MGQGINTVEYLSADGRTYEITVDIPEAAAIPEGAKLHVTEVSRYATD